MATLPHLRKTPAKHSRELKYVILAFRRFPRYSTLGKLAKEDPSRRETQSKMRRRRREERKEGKKTTIQEESETRRKEAKKKRRKRGKKGGMKKKGRLKRDKGIKRRTKQEE